MDETQTEMKQEVEAEPTSSHYQLHGEPEARCEFFAALAKAQASFSPVEKSATVDYTDRNGRRICYKYAPFASLRDATSKQIGDNGLAFVCMFSGDISGDPSNRVMTATALLTHASGAMLEHVITFRPAPDIKELAGQQTYLRRYIYQAILSLQGEAEDLVEKGDATPQQKKQASPKKKDPDLYQNLADAKSRAGIGDGHTQTISRVMFGLQVGSLEDKQLRQLVYLIGQMTSTDSQAVKDADGPDGVAAVVGTVKDRILKAKAQNAAEKGGDSNDS